MNANYNLIKKEDIVKPNYLLGSEYQRMKCVFLSDREVLLIGMADNNYYFWISKTDIAAQEINAEIIEFILYGKYKSVAYSSVEFSVLDSLDQNRNDLYSIYFYKSFNWQGEKIRKISSFFR